MIFERLKKPEEFKFQGRIYSLKKGQRIVYAEDSAESMNTVLGRIIQDYINGDDAYKYRNQERYKRARNELTKLNYPLAKTIAKTFWDKKDANDLDELVQEAHIGLDEATKDFNPDIAQFSTYAAIHIKKRLKRLKYQNNNGVIRVPYYLWERGPKILRIQQDLRDQTNKEPSPEEIAKALNQENPDKRLNPWQVQKYLEHQEQQISSLSGRGKDYQIPENTNPPLKILEKTETETRLINILNNGVLDTREKEIICHRFGINGADFMTLRQLGKSMGLTKERVRQIEKEALGKLRKVMSDKDTD